MTTAAEKKLNLERATNFMRQYRDPQSRELKKLSANQFMEVWSHYDKDGEHLDLQDKSDNEHGKQRIIQSEKFVYAWRLVDDLSWLFNTLWKVKTKVTNTSVVLLLIRG